MMLHYYFHVQKILKTVTDTGYSLVSTQRDSVLQSSGRKIFIGTEKKEACV